MSLNSIYKLSLALLTDLYELTMAYGYWKEGLAERNAVFHLSFRRKPFQGSFAIAAGLQTAIEYIQSFHFDESDLTYLASLKGKGDQPLFEQGFLDYLKNFSFECDLDAMPEGTPVFPYEPLLRVQGPIIQAQLLESALLNIVNFQSLIATKAARISWAARPDPVVEFGLRRAQGIDGALSASRAAFIGGCESTSSVLAGKLFDIPVRGTHAHSWVMAFDDEAESFKAFAEALPHNCVFLVDTYDSLTGAKNAIKVAKELGKNMEMLGVRLDSGDLTHLSIQIRKLLDDAGFTEAKIMASNELDEHLIRDLKHQGAKISIWGVGTNLVTGKDQPALDGVYKLSAFQDQNSKWQYKVKISEQIAKVTDPGILQVRRYFDERGYLGDMLYDTLTLPGDPHILIDPTDPTHTKKMLTSTQFKDLLVPILRKGKPVYKHPSLKEIQRYAQTELDRFHPAIRRFLNPQPYFVGMEKSLYNLKVRMIEEIQERIP